MPSPSAATQRSAVLKASGIRVGELAGIRYDPDDASRSDLDLQQREITVRGKGGRPRVVRSRARGSAGSGQVRPHPVKACAGVAASAVAGGEQPGSDDR